MNIVQRIDESKIPHGRRGHIWIDLALLRWANVKGSAELRQDENGKWVIVAPSIYGAAP